MKKFVKFEFSIYGLHTAVACSAASPGPADSWERYKCDWSFVACKPRAAGARRLQRAVCLFQKRNVLL